MENTGNSSNAHLGKCVRKCLEDTHKKNNSSVVKENVKEVNEMPNRTNTGNEGLMGGAKRGRKPAKKSAKKPATKKPATKKPATKKPATKKPATKKPAAKKPASKKPAAKKTTKKRAPKKEKSFLEKLFGM